MAGAGPDTAIAYDQRIARRVAALLAHTPVSPNGVTAASIVVGLGAALLLARGDAWTHLGAALFVVAVWMDHLDGELARMTNRTSTFGHYFDHVAALTNYVSGFVGAGYGLRASFGGPLGHWGPEFGVTAGIAIAAIMSVRLRMEIRDGRASVRQTVCHGFEVEDVLYLLGPLTWLGLLPYFIAVAGIGAPVFLLYVIWELLRGARRAAAEVEAEAAKDP